MAATFLHLETGSAFRVVSTEVARELVHLYAPKLAGEREQAVEAYKRMPESVLFRVQQVRIDLDEMDLPGPTGSKAICAQCGQAVRDGREIIVDGRSLCLPCAQGAYFKEAREVNWDGMETAPIQGSLSEWGCGAAIGSSVQHSETGIREINAGKNS